MSHIHKCRQCGYSLPSEIYDAFYSFLNRVLWYVYMQSTQYICTSLIITFSDTNYKVRDEFLCRFQTRARKYICPAIARYLLAADIRFVLSPERLRGGECKGSSLFLYVYVRLVCRWWCNHLGGRWFLILFLFPLLCKVHLITSIEDETGCRAFISNIYNLIIVRI